jgi:ABC-type uncharacterized transport system substrate-binding protein
VTVIATNSTAAALRGKELTGAIPIIFGSGGDPVQTGLVASLNRPGGNVTGIGSMSGELGPKRLGLLHELLPRAKRFAMLVRLTSPTAGSEIADVQAAAAAIGAQVEVLSAITNHDIDLAFASLVQKRADALLTAVDSHFIDRRVQLVGLAMYHRMPAIYWVREQAEVGGLMSYGLNLVELYRQVGLYSGRILRGEKPADLPIMRPTKFQFVINLQTARTLSIEIPPTLLAIADEVIE